MIDRLQLHDAFDLVKVASIVRTGVRREYRCSHVQLVLPLPYGLFCDADNFGNVGGSVIKLTVEFARHWQF